MDESVAIEEFLDLNISQETEEKEKENKNLKYECRYCDKSEKDFLLH
jgi:hypothetical protein